MGRFGFGFGGTLHRSVPGAIVAAPQVPLAIAANGWQATAANPADLSLAPMSVTRDGFDTAGSVTTWPETILLTKRVRQPYPAYTQFTPDQVALSDYVYQSDVIPDLANNSTQVSPKPIANWVMPSREVVGDTVSWEIIAFHRDARPDPATGIGRQVACVRVRASDGIQQSAWQTVSGTVISDLCEDGCPLEVYRGALDIGGLDEGLIWLEAEVLPWFGGAASILRSEDSAVAREFSRRYYLKNTARAANPPLIYVSSTGNNTNGVVSADPAIAAATPCETVGGALGRARAQLGATQGALDGLRIRVVDNVSMGAVPYQADYPQDIGAVIIERAPSTNRATAVIDWSANVRTYFKTHTAPVTEGALTFRDVTINRSAATTIYGEAANQLLVQFHDVSFANNSHSGTLRASSHLAVFGMDLTGYKTVFARTNAGEVRILRGLTADMTNSGAEAWVTAGCILTSASSGAYADAAKGAIFCSNQYIAPVATTGPLVFAGTVSGSDIGPIAIVQNLVEITHTAVSAASVRLCADSDFGNIAHAVIMHNTATGAGQVGRWNLFYDEHSSVQRYHQLIAFKGNLASQFNTKGDVFKLNGSRTGNFAFVHGVGCAGSYAVDDANSPHSEHQSYAGGGSVIGNGDAGFVDYQGTTGTGVAPVSGTGGGDYHLLPESPARDLLAGPVLAFDLSGALRCVGPQAAGAYA